MGLSYRPGSRALLATLPPATRRRMKEALRILEGDPRDGRLDLKRLDDERTLYRCRIGDYRIVFELRARTTYVHRIVHRRDGYGWLERL